MVRRPTIRSGAVLGVALGGLLAGHALAYAALVPDPPARAAMLAATGHGYLHGADAVAIVVALAGLAVAFLGRLTSKRTDRPTAGALAVRLATFQAIGFVTVEVAERLSAGAPMGDLARALPVGIAIQVLLALVSAWFLRWLLRVADRVAELADRANIEVRAGWTPIRLAPEIARGAPALGGVGNRSPPLLVA